MDPLHKLIEIFREFPGIGPRQARRFAFFLVSRPNNFLEELVDLIGEVKRTMRTCYECKRHFTSEAPQTVCSICSNPHRDRSILMIVARDTDMEALEKTRAYQGLYFILGGTIPILDKDPEQRIRIRDLHQRLQALPLRELIISLNATPEGEHTADYVMNSLKDYAAEHSVAVSVLGRGLSTGSELEYADASTLTSALVHRTKV
jgi:recombination protein RecR